MYQSNLDENYREYYANTGESSVSEPLRITPIDFGGNIKVDTVTTPDVITPTTPTDAELKDQNTIQNLINASLAANKAAVPEIPSDENIIASSSSNSGNSSVMILVVVGLVAVVGFYLWRKNNA